MKRSRLRERLDRVPMLKAVVPLAVGIALADRYTLPGWFLAAACCLTGTTALLRRSSLAMLALLVAAGFAAAQLRSQEPAVPRDVFTAFCLRIDAIPSDRGAYRSAEGVVTAWRDPADGRWHAAGDRVLVRADSSVEIAAGDRLRCRARIRPLRGGAESYRRLMAHRGFAGSLWLSPVHLLDRTPDGGTSLHLRAAGRLARLELPPEAGAVLRAMAAGDRSGLTPDLRSRYARSGFSHLLALSGLHTGIVFLLINVLLAWLPLLRHGHLLRSVLGAAAVWLFVAAAGFPASAVRAAVMCTLLQAALLTASEYVALNALAAAAFGMLLWNPAWLHDIGFQLSFTAVGAILAWGVPLCRRIRTGRRLLDALLDAYAIGLVATAATVPLVSHTFGILPLAGVLFNPAAILLAGAVVLSGVMWMLLPIGALAQTIAFTVRCAAEGIDSLARLCASIPGGAAAYTLDGGATAALYLLFAAATAAAWSIEPQKSVSLPT